MEELVGVFTEGKATTIKIRRPSVTVKVAGDNLILSIAQDDHCGSRGTSYITLLMSLYLAASSRLLVTFTTDTLKVGTRKAIPMNIPFSSAMSVPTSQWFQG